MNLLDPNIQNYVFKWDESHTSPSKFNLEVQNENGEKIGETQTIGSFPKRIYLLDIQNSKLLSVSKKGFSLTREYVIKDSPHNQIATVRQKLLLLHSVLTMKNSDGDEILTCKVLSSLLGNHEIDTLDGKNVAEFFVKEQVKKKGRWRHNRYDTCILRINDSNFDRKSVLGMLISCLLYLEEK